jgi:hypothetical protein
MSVTCSESVLHRGNSGFSPVQGGTSFFYTFFLGVLGRSCISRGFFSFEIVYDVFSF